MPYARILVDGDGLLEHWTTLEPDQPRNAPEARDALLDQLTQFYDVNRTPLTVVFDDVDPVEAEEDDEPSEPPEVQVLFTQKRQRLGQAIERIARRFRSSGEILVIGRCGDNAPDPAEDESIYREFIQEVEETLRDLESNLHHLHEKERAAFDRNPS